MKPTGKQALKVICIILYSFSLGWSACKHMQQDNPNHFGAASLVVALVGLIALLVAIFTGPICQRKEEIASSKTSPRADNASQE